MGHKFALENWLFGWEYIHKVQEALGRREQMRREKKKKKGECIPINMFNSQFS